MATCILLIFRYLHHTITISKLDRTSVIRIFLAKTMAMIDWMGVGRGLEGGGVWVVEGWGVCLRGVWVGGGCGLEGGGGCVGEGCG